jgi:hypothetical protein
LLQVFKHHHEETTGRTSSIGQHNLCLDSKGQILNDPQFRNTTCGEYVKQASKVVTLVDLAGGMRGNGVWAGGGGGRLVGPGGGGETDWWGGAWPGERGEGEGVSQKEGKTGREKGREDENYSALHLHCCA